MISIKKDESFLRINQTNLLQHEWHCKQNDANYK